MLAVASMGMAVRAIEEAQAALPLADTATRASIDAFIAGLETKKQ